MNEVGQHRRGLVLGLTLAEVLLLLLFLLLLALGAKLKELDRAKSRAEADLADLKAIKASRSGTGSIVTGSLASQERPELRVDGAGPKPSKVLSVRATEALGVLQRLGSSELEELAVALGLAAKINPDAPPVALREAASWRSQLQLDSSQFTALSAAWDAAARAHPLDPGRALVEALALLQSLPEGVSPDSVKAYLTAHKQGGHKWPPIITLSEADGQFFASGSAELPAHFKEALSRDVVTRLLEITALYDVDVIEVIGHTDEQPVGRQASNLDSSLHRFLTGEPPAEGIVAADNAGLGIARAASVVRALRADARLAKFRILPLSAAQLIDLGDTLSFGKAPASVEKRRRIEIRVRRSNPAPDAKGPIQNTNPRSAQANRIPPATSPSDEKAGDTVQRPREPLVRDWRTHVFQGR